VVTRRPERPPSDEHPAAARSGRPSHEHLAAGRIGRRAGRSGLPAKGALDRERRGCGDSRAWGHCRPL